MRRRATTGRALVPLVVEGTLFLLFAVLLVRLFLVPVSRPDADVHWWAWLAVAPPLFLALLIEWRRKKRPVVTREELRRRWRE